VYGRVRPPRPWKREKRRRVRRKVADYAVENARLLHVRAPRMIGSTEVNNSIDRFQFKFSHLFDAEATQANVFDAVARDVVQSVIDGYNGTVFAYGQSGSGKTYSMTGGPSSFEERGIIPRALAYIFEHIASDASASYAVRISYLEIYQNRGYDLLDPDHEPQKVQDLNAVVMKEDKHGNMQLSNIKALPVSTREDALNHLFVGDTNRMICETANNDLSSRSHCIFTVEIEARQLDSDKIRRSKLNLVDLAGSERQKVVSTRHGGGGGSVDNVGINLSLHHLANVIVALHEVAKGRRTHVPYRNSMLTHFLRDSLGGNCKTAMLATLSVEREQVLESVSTCRFAERVAQIPNTAVINEAYDPKLEIQRLREQLSVFKRREEEGVEGAGGASKREPLDDDQRRRLVQLVQLFLLPDAARSEARGYKPLPTNDARKVRLVYNLLRDIILAIRCEALDGVADPLQAAAQQRRRQRHEERRITVDDAGENGEYDVDARRNDGTGQYMTSSSSFSLPRATPSQLQRLDAIIANLDELPSARGVAPPRPGVMLSVNNAAAATTMRVAMGGAPPAFHVHHAEPADTDDAADNTSHVAVSPRAATPEPRHRQRKSVQWAAQSDTSHYDAYDADAGNGSDANNGGGGGGVSPRPEAVRRHAWHSNDATTATLPPPPPPPSSSQPSAVAVSPPPPSPSGAAVSSSPPRELSPSAAAAFDAWKVVSPLWTAIAGNRAALRERIAEAAALGKQIVASQRRVNALKQELMQAQHLRHQNGEDDDDEEDDDDDADGGGRRDHEQRLLADISTAKAAYKQEYRRLKALKAEIEHLRRVVRRDEQRLRSEFDAAAAAAEINAADQIVCDDYDSGGNENVKHDVLANYTDVTLEKVRHSGGDNASVQQATLPRLERDLETRVAAARDLGDVINNLRHCIIEGKKAMKAASARRAMQSSFGVNDDDADDADDTGGGDVVDELRRRVDDDKVAYRAAFADLQSAKAVVAALADDIRARRQRVTDVNGDDTSDVASASVPVISDGDDQHVGDGRERAPLRTLIAL
jgi:hypothetical protein